MADFYTRKTNALSRCEETIKEITKQGKLASEDLLYSEINRETGFSTVIRKHVADLITAGKVKRSFSELGQPLLSWVGA